MEAVEKGKPSLEYDGRCFNHWESGQRKCKTNDNYTLHTCIEVFYMFVKTGQRIGSIAQPEMRVTDSRRGDSILFIR